MSAKVTIVYTDEAELQEIIKRLQPLIGRVKGPFQTPQSKYYRVHIRLKSAARNAGKPPYLGA